MEYTAFLVGGGDFNEKKFLSLYKSSTRARYTIAVDKGYKKIKALVPIDFVLGDFDSLGYVPSCESVEQFPCDKDFTDMQAALEKCLSKNIAHVYMCGALGGRLDHTLANLQNACAYAKKGLKISLYGLSESIYILTEGSITLDNLIGRTLSVFALENASGVSISGCKYSLNNKSLTTDYPLGISNIVTNNCANFSLESGIIAIVVNDILHEID